MALRRQGTAASARRSVRPDDIIGPTITAFGLLAMIAGVYLTVVVAVPRLLFGGGEDRLAPQLLATAIVALAFEPTRRWLRRRVERLIHGDRASPLDVLSAATAQLSASADHGTEALARLVARGSGADRAVVWALAGETMQPTGWWPSETETLPVAIPRSALVSEPHREVAPVRHGEVTIGAISLTKPASAPVTDVDRDLLRDVAGGSGLVLRNLGLHADLAEQARRLRASRRRLVATRDAERQRLERDLHDGAQQHVVVLKMKLDLARSMATRGDGSAVADRLTELSAMTQDAVEALRAVSHGLYPPRLEADGLVPALTGLVAPDGLEFTVGAEEVERLPRRLEETMYFTVLELLAGIDAAGGGRLEVGLTGTPGRIELTALTDRTVAPAAMTAIGDRVAAGDGSLAATASDSGWRLDIALPVHPESETETV
ncbi:MAG: histidine kinase [Actinomycetota bacterium]